MKSHLVRKFFFICLLGALLCQTSTAQRRDRTIFQFQHTGWTAKDGAPGGVNGIAETTDGYLWFANATGLYRFDGIRFERYQPPPGQEFKSDNISTLMATVDGGLWIGFGYGGADFLKDGRLTSYSDSGVLRGTIFNFAADLDGTVWAATYTGLARFDGSQWQAIGNNWGYNFTSAQMNVFVDRAGTLWVGVGNDLLFLPRGEKNFRKSPDNKAAVVSMAQTPDGTLWLSEFGGGGNHTKSATIRPVRPITGGSTATSQLLPPIQGAGIIQATMVDRAGSLWIACDKGIARVAYPERYGNSNVSASHYPDLEIFTNKDGLTADATGTGTVFEDRDGNIWVSTILGVDRFRESNVVPVAPYASIPVLSAGDNADAWAVMHDPAVEVGSRNRLLHLHELTISALPMPDFIPTAASRSANGAGWFAGEGFFWRFEDGHFTNRIPYPDGVSKKEFVQSIAADRMGKLWASIEGGGIFSWANGIWTHHVYKPEFTDEPAVSLFADSSNRIWMGYMDGKIVLVDGDHVRMFSSADGLRVVNIQAIHEHGGDVWIGGEHGLALYRNNHFQSLTPDGSAPFNGISGIFETADGDLWLNATPGIFRIPAAEIGRAIEIPAYCVHYELFNLLDNLNGTAMQLRPIPTVVASTDGRLWFTTYNGIVQIDPNHLLRNAVPPSVFVRSMDSGGVVYPATGGATLPPRTTSVHLEYIAPNLSVPERVHYRYRLEGADSDWQDAGTRREAFYTNLGPGHYRFRVIASNNDGVWNNVGAETTFTIAPAWFQTIWFNFLCAAISLLMIWSLYKFRVRYIAKTLGARFDERLAERTRMARELHDTFLQTVQGSKMVADNALHKDSDEARMRHALERLSLWLGQAVTEGRAALHALRVSASEKNHLAESLQQAAQENCGHVSLSLSLTVIGDAKDLHPIVRDEISRIGYEAIRNACMHSHGSQLEIELRYADDLTMAIKDNGVGIDPAIVNEGKDGHFGLQGMRERAARIRGKLTIVSTLNAGTALTLRVPGNLVYRNDHLTLLEKIARTFRRLVGTSHEDSVE